MNQLTLLLVGALLLGGSGPDHVKLEDGKILDGRVVQESRDAVVLRANNANRTILRKDITDLTTLERSLAKIVAREVGTGDAVAYAGLAVECEKAELVAEARLMWMRVLLADPSNAAAIKALDARALKDDVAFKIGKDQHKLSEMRKPQPKWKEAYELETTHFVLRTDMELGRALDVGLDLERFHQRFYDLLGKPLELFIFDERELPEIRVYSEPGAYPSPPVPGERVWFGVAENCLHVAAEQPVDVPSVVYELSRQMLFSAMRRSAGPTAQVPAWVATGISQYFAMAAPQKRGLPWASATEPFKTLFQTAAASDVTFERLFRGVPDDFTNGPKASEMSADAYTLLHFFRFGRDGELRDGFGKYVTEGAKGKLSMSALTDHVKLKPDEIEKAWREYVRANAQ